MSFPKVSLPYANLLPTQLTDIAVFRSTPFVRHPSATMVTLLVQANQAGTFDVEALKFGGDPLVAADWYTYNTPAEQVTVVANTPARFTISGGAPAMRILYTPAAPATLAMAAGWYVGYAGSGA